MSDQKHAPFEHPSLKEGFTDKIYRYINEMDFRGQELAEKVVNRGMLICSIIAFAVGYKTQQFSHVVYIMLACMFALMLFAGSAFGPYKSHPLKWKPYSIDKSYLDQQAKEGKKKQ